MSRFVIISGGTVSNVGKGTIAGSLGRLFKNRGVKVTIQKLDPYLNVDPGTMSPYQHGEVYTTDDGGECDLDIGHYERFLDTSIPKSNNVSIGRLFTSVINKERTGKYVGATVQILPHVSTEAKETMLSVGNQDYDVVIVEIGGTIGDVETEIFLNAVRNLKSQVGEGNFFHLHIELVPMIEAINEAKYEAIEASIQKLNSYGLSPDAVICRTSKNVKLSPETKTKIAKRCFLKNSKSILQVPDVKTIYEIPLLLAEQGLDDIILNKFKFESPKVDLNSWSFMVSNYKTNYPEARICIVGKYTKVPDAYISIQEAIIHAGTYNQIKPKIEFIDAEDLEEVGAEKFLHGAKAIIVPPGWGSRGFNGMLQAVRYARENKIPYLGIGLGMQIAIIEFARDVLLMPKANTTEIDPETDFPVVDVMEKQKSLVMNGGTMRLGAYNCVLDPNSVSAKLYGKELISERHRHRYEFNSTFYDKFEKEGMVLAGMNPESKLIELVELKNHPFFVASIFEPDKLSRPNRPHPLFMGLMNTAKSVR